MPRSTILVHFLFIAFGILAIAFAIEFWLAPAVGHRPDIEQALDSFIERYPGAVVNEIRITEDEVLARSFEIDYRNKVSGSVGRLNVRYVDRGDGKWEMRSEPPTRLP